MNRGFKLTFANLFLDGDVGQLEEEHHCYALKLHGKFKFNYSIGGQKFLEKRNLTSNESTAKVDRAFSVALAGIIVNSVEPDAVSLYYL